MLTFQTRPFSNSFEAVIVALTLVIPGTLPAWAPAASARVGTATSGLSGELRRRALWFGLLVALGSFARITYPGFAFPIGLYLLAAADLQRRKLSTTGLINVMISSLISKSNFNFFFFEFGHSEVSLFQRLLWAAETSLTVLFAFVCSAAVFVLIDSVYFGWLHLEFLLPASAIHVEPFLVIDSWAKAGHLLRGTFGFEPFNAMMQGRWSIQV